MEIKRSVFYNYYFKGSRNYVHGTTIFESFCRVLKDSQINVFDVKGLKFHRELHRNGRIILVAQPNEAGNFNCEDPMVSMSFLVGGRPAQIYLLEAAGSDVVDRREDTTDAHINKVVKTGDYESESTLTDIKDFETLVAAIVEVNKKTHAKTVHGPQEKYNYRWAFLQNLPVDLNAEFPEKIDVHIKHIGHKKGSDGMVYTLNKIIFSLNDKKHQTVISFSYFKK